MKCRWGVTIFYLSFRNHNYKLFVSMSWAPVRTYKEIIILLRRMSQKAELLGRFDLRDKRSKYDNEDNVFTEDDLVSKNPIIQFKQWLELAMKTPGIAEANAMCLATANRHGMPSARYILLKECGPDGFLFFTNFSSRKAKDLEENPQAALTFYWEPLHRSVRIEGKVEKISDAESTEYFQSRPRNSQISACVSNQSNVVPSRGFLKERCESFIKQVQGQDIPKPAHWGGYKVVPHAIEFWQGQSSRLHDRIKFRKLKGDEVIDNTVTHMGDDNWVYERLYP